VAEYFNLYYRDKLQSMVSKYELMHAFGN